MKFNTTLEHAKELRKELLHNKDYRRIIECKSDTTLVEIFRSEETSYYFYTINNKLVAYEIFDNGDYVKIKVN